MTHPRSHAELVTLRKLAQEVAAARKERMTTVHLIAAIAAGSSPAGELLRDRRLDEESLLKASRSFDDEGPDPIGRVLGAARQVATRHPSPEPTALHLLLALLADRTTAAHRALLQAGVDLARLRASGMQLALGVVAPRRPSPPTRGVRLEVEPAAERRSLSARAASPLPSSPPPPAPRARPSAPPTPSALQPGVAVPLFPPPMKRASTTAPPSDPPPASTTHPTRAPRAAAPASVAPPAPRAVNPGPYALDKAVFPALSSIGQNLTLAAAEGRLDEVVGRDAEMDKCLDVLGKRHGSSPCLVGPPGVGKTAIARGLAQRLVEIDRGTEAPRVLVELSIAELCAQAGTRTAVNERIAALRNEAREARDHKARVILFIDDLHELFLTSGLEQAAGELRLAMGRGELHLVGATTPEEYRKSVEADGAIARCFTAVEVEEPTAEDAFLQLRALAQGLGKHHGVAYSDEALAASVGWSVRYLPGRALPDKAITILDLAGARTRRQRVLQMRPGAKLPDGIEITPSEVAAVVAEMADLPVERLLETDRDRMLSMEKLLAERVVGHAPAIARIARVLRRNAAGLRGRRPIGSFLLLGPTGVGKTETAKAIAEALFHSPDAMTRLDFSEYAEAHAVARLIGAPPGYVGHEAGGQLTEAVRRRPYQVILLDEIEKAHRDVLEAFLQVFDEGRLTDGRGRRVDFTNTVIVLTSNLGAAEVSQARAERSVGFARGNAGQAAADKQGEIMLAAARAHLPPELYNRLDEVLCFKALERPEVAEIAKRLLLGLEQNLLDRNIRLDVDPAVVDCLLVEGGFDATLGARPMKRTIARLIENPLAELILRGDLDEGGVALVGVEKGAIIVDAVGSEEAAQAAAG